MECPKGDSGQRGDWVAWAFMDLGRELPGSTASLPRVITAPWRRNQPQDMRSAGPERDERPLLARFISSKPTLALAIRPSEPSRALALCV